ncbi:MAG: DNA polymerase ligase N-terminal domain-containing protein [Solirubrobacteraceae bacterium]
MTPSARRSSDPDAPRALRAQLSPAAADAGLAEAVRADALRVAVLGWVRGDAPLQGPVEVHAEGAPDALVAFVATLEGRGELRSESVRVEGHEQFSVRGVPAGVFVVQEHRASTHHYDLRLVVGGRMRSWAVPKGPSLDPSAKRLAVQVEDHEMSHNEFEGATDSGGVIVWDRGPYEQGGRVAWPEALERGHAVFVLHGEKLRGGFALQRTRPTEPPQWLLVKRRDGEARSGSDVIAERPESVLSGRTLDELIAGD